MTDENSKLCFVISPIGEPESDTRKRSDQILRHIIRPAVEAKGYGAVRADEISEPGIITAQVIQHVVDDPLVLADLTERNPNVFYELAIRHAIRKPFVQIINIGESIPFDVAATRTVFVDHHDLDNVDTAKSEIQEQISALESDSTSLETPISVALDLQTLRRSENPGERSLADVLSELSGIRSALSEFEERISTSSGGLTDRREFRYLEDRLSRKIEEVVFSTQHRSRRRNMDPSQVISLVRSGMTDFEDIVAVPVLLSFIREDLPWIYELGMEGHRQTTMGNTALGHELFRAVLHLIERGVHGNFDTPDLHVSMMELRQKLRIIIGHG